MKFCAAYNGNGGIRTHNPAVVVWYGVHRQYFQLRYVPIIKKQLLYQKTTTIQSIYPSRYTSTTKLESKYLLLSHHIGPLNNCRRYSSTTVIRLLRGNIARNRSKDIKYNFYLFTSLSNYKTKKVTFTAKRKADVVE